MNLCQSTTTVIQCQPPKQRPRTRSHLCPTMGISLSRVRAPLAPASRGPAADSSERPETEEDDDDEEELDSSEYVADNSDDFYCEYDSTWESSSPSHPRRDNRRRVFRSYKFDRFENAAKDMQNYRHDYPKSRLICYQGSGMPNLEFYLGKRPSSPGVVFIYEFHTQWYQKYYKLEHEHTFIQWLFPLQEKGVNYQASELTEEEIEAFCANNTAKMNLLESYKLMLDFYGIELCSVETGEVKRAPNWKERFYNLNHNTHNNLRITRILKCLGTLGFTHYQVPLVRFFLEETLIHGELPNVKQSALNYFMFAVRDKKKRRRLVKFAYMNYDCKDEFVWCPKKIQMMWSKKTGFPYSSRPMGIMTQQGDDGTYHHDVRSQNVYHHDGSTARVTSTADPESSLYQKESTVPVTSPWYKQSTNQTNRHVDSPAKAQSPDSLADLDQQTTPDSHLANSSLDYGNQMSDDRHHGEAVKIDIPLSDGGDLTAEEKPYSEEEPMDIC
ncbi:opioid growth factor receptor-like protein 1 isoform X2 [Myripristis murdjan]|uniref:opioid growth factor receptor-like protein 1 isoform X2 n=1 Tax=Myripristis murdjan TaxID=586833 RepID=UPI001176306E|nr:opioid growth factor receptor-like protein 1 isoform X2 [Myripristis murdjan]